jgi:hypothetical protein
MVLQHHISNAFLRTIQFVVCGFQSLLLTVSQLVSFPGGTKTFQFPPFPDLAVLKGSPIRRSPGQPLRAGRRSLSQLATSFFVVENQVLHHTGSVDSFLGCQFSLSDSLLKPRLKSSVQRPHARSHQKKREDKTRLGLCCQELRTPGVVACEGDQILLS